LSRASQESQALAEVLAILFLVGGFILLIKGAEWLIDGASSLALRFSISEIVVGLTVVAFGTSSPELIVNIVAAFKGNYDISIGNIVGSNIANIWLILGISGIIRPLPTRKNTIWREMPFALLAVAVLIVLVNDRLLNASVNMLSRGDGVVLLLFFVIFIVYIFAISKVDVVDSPEIKERKVRQIVILIAVGLAALLFGGKLVVDNAVILARQLQISDRVIGLTIMAVGTSLPELFTSAVAAYKRKADIAIGNIIGSNIFNILFILATTSLIAPLPFSNIVNVDLMVLFLASTLLFITMFTGKRRILDRWEAIVFVMLYFGYIYFLIL
jgi:cation:H+ antiporter